MSPRTARFYERIAAYFGPDAGPVIVAEEFTAAGWTPRPRFRKRMTHSWARKLRREGVTHVALRAGARTADFALAELLSARAA